MEQRRGVRQALIDGNHRVQPWRRRAGAIPFHRPDRRKEASARPDHRLSIELSDGRRGVFDLRPFLDRPGLQRLKDPAYFATVGIRFGALTRPQQEDVALDTLVAHPQVAGSLHALP